MPIVSVVVYSVIIIVGTVGNGLVIYVTGYRMKKSVNSIWFLNLALADFIFTLFLIFPTIITSRQNQWPFGGFMCKFNNFVAVISMFSSIFLLMVISLDRCLTVWVVVWAQNKRTIIKAQVTTVLVWLIAAICSAPYASYRSVLTREGKEYCSYSPKTPVWTLTIFRFFVGFFIPFLVICASNVAIYVRARRLHGTRSNKSNRIIFAIIFAFFICWLPFHVIQLLEIKGLTDKSFSIFVQLGGPATVMLAFTNSCLNPILYVFMCDEFRKKLKRSLFLVLESALSEEQLHSRSFSSHFSITSRRSEFAAPLQERQETSTEVDLLPTI